MLPPSSGTVPSLRTPTELSVPLSEPPLGIPSQTRERTTETDSNCLLNPDCPSLVPKLLSIRLGRDLGTRPGCPPPEYGLLCSQVLCKQLSLVIGDTQVCLLADVCICTARRECCARPAQSHAVCGEWLNATFFSRYLH